MTREKKEILKRIEEIETWIAVDMNLGCGFAPPDCYDDLYQEINNLLDRLAHLCGYENHMEMEQDQRRRAGLYAHV
jgi:hypothetical protein